jgi:hypothetical protein
MTAMASLLLINFPIVLGFLPGEFNVVRNFLN